MSGPAPGDSGPSTREAVEMWRDGSAAWRWRYVNRDAGVDLPGNRGYETREAALEAAALAYPGIPILERDSNPPPSRPVVSVPAMVSGAIALALATLFLVVTIVSVACLALVPFALRTLARAVRALVRR